MVAPLNPEAVQLGLPTLKFTGNGFGSGSVEVTMPDGEHLAGQFTFASGSSVATVFGPRGSATAIASSDSGNFYATAAGPKTTLVCRGQAAGGHGGGECVTPDGARWQVMF